MLYSTLSGIIGLAVFHGIGHSLYHFLIRSMFIVLFTVIFSFSSKAQISGTVFIDSNENGLLDAKELRIQGVQLKVYSYDATTSIHPLQVTVTSDQLGNYRISPSSYPVKLELVLDPDPFPIIPGKGYIQLPQKELYPFPGLIFNQSGMHDFALPVNISYK